jgi:hypothetical protein
VVPIQVLPPGAAAGDTALVAPGREATFTIQAVDGMTAPVWYFFAWEGSLTRLRDCSGQMSCTIIPPKRGSVIVYGKWNGYTFGSEYLHIKTVAAELQLTCTPNPVTRGAVIACSAAATGGTLDSLRWEFVGPSGDTVSGPDGIASWGGTMVVGGTITVSARLNGSPASDDTLIVVEPRRWPRITVRGIDDGHGDLPNQPRHIHDLAHTHPPFSPAPWDVATISDGPNTGWAYLRSIANQFGAKIHINAGFQPGTPFYNMQAPGIDPVTGDPFCRKSQMAAVERGAREHEGLVSSASTSHLDVFQLWFRNNAPQDSLEKVTVFVPALSYHVNDFIDAEYSEMVATPTFDDPNQRHTSNVPPGLVPFPTVPCRPRLYP